VAVAYANRASQVDRPPRRRRRAPEEGVLYRVLAEHLETFLDLTADRLPGFVARELRKYLHCGVLAAGFARVRCSGCGKDELVAFSCKGRAFCPSCGGRRMVDLAAQLTDRVLPHVPVRQWVLTFPWTIRFLLAYDPELQNEVRRIFLSTILRWMEKRANRRGLVAAKGGAVNLVSIPSRARWPSPSFTRLRRCATRTCSRSRAFFTTAFFARCAAAVTLPKMETSLLTNRMTFSWR